MASVWEPFNEYLIPGAILFGWTAIVFLLLLLLLLRSCYLVKATTDPAKYRNKTNIFTIGAITCFCIACICSAAVFPIALYSWGAAILVNILGGFIWMCAQVMVYILLIIKLHDAFDGTRYQSPIRTYYRLGIILFIFGSSESAKLVLIGFEDIYMNQDGYVVPSVHSELLYRMAICDGIMAVVDILLTFSLVYLFSSKLVSIAVQSVRNDGNIHLHYKSRENQQKLSIFINVVVKHTILTSIATVATQIHILYWTIKNFYVSRSDNQEVWIWGGMFENLMWPTQMVINSLCILQYLPNEKFYDKCHGCHAWCKLFFMQCARRKIRREMESQFHYRILGGPTRPDPIELNSSTTSGLWKNPNEL